MAQPGMPKPVADGVFKICKFFERYVSNMNISVYHLSILGRIAVLRPVVTLPTE